MNGMFSECRKFNKNISKWNVSNVSDMKNMFKECTSLNPDFKCKEID